MNDPYSPPQTPSHSFFIARPKLPWHAKLVIAMLTLSAIWSLVGIVNYFISLFKTGAAFSGSLFVVYIVILYPTLLLGSAFLLYRRSKHAYLPLILGCLIFVWHLYQAFKFYTFPGWYNFYGSYFVQLTKYIDTLPRWVLNEIFSGVVLSSATYYCIYQSDVRKKAKH